MPKRPASPRDCATPKRISPREDATRARLDLEKAEALKDLQEEMDDLLEVLGMEERQKDFLFRDSSKKARRYGRVGGKVGAGLTANIEADEVAIDKIKNRRLFRALILRIFFIIERRDRE